MNSRRLSVASHFRIDNLAARPLVLAPKTGVLLAYIRDTRNLEVIRPRETLADVAIVASIGVAAPNFRSGFNCLFIAGIVEGFVPDVDVALIPQKYARSLEARREGRGWHGSLIK